MDILTIIFSVVIVIISVVFHELAHGAVADWMGDPTARLSGRLTLNPLSHLEWLGSFFLPLLCVISGSGFIIGWAKPVPYNPNMLKYKRWGPAIVAFAGPLMNSVIAVVCAIGFRLTVGLSGPETLGTILSMIVMINVSLAVFNLVPLPPLDGHHILGSIIPAYRRWSDNLMRGYGFMVMILVILFAGSIVGPVISFLAKLLLM